MVPPTAKDVIKGPEKRSLCWIIQMGQYNAIGVFIRERQREAYGDVTKRRRRCEEGGRGWSNVTTSQGMQMVIRSWKSKE